MQTKQNSNLVLNNDISPLATFAKNTEIYRCAWLTILENNKSSYTLDAVYHRIFIYLRKCSRFSFRCSFKFIFYHTEINFSLDPRQATSLWLDFFSQDYFVSSPLEEFIQQVSNLVNLLPNEVPVLCFNLFLHIFSLNEVNFFCLIVYSLVSTFHKFTLHKYLYTIK